MLKAGKATVVAGGTKLKKRNKQAAEDKMEEKKQASSNPWDGMEVDGGSDEINEDDLMKDTEAMAKITDKFSGAADRIMPGKPCDNCNCGLADKLAGKEVKDKIKKLETG